MSMEGIGKWCFIIGLILVLIAAIAAVAGVTMSWVGPVLVILGLIVGFLNISSSETTPFLVAAIALLILNPAILGEVMWIGGFLTQLIWYLIAFVSPVALVVAVKTIISHASD